MGDIKNKMEIIDLIEALFQNQDFLFKIGLIIMTAFYSLFALIVTIQIFSLNNILTIISFSPIFKAIALLHFAASLALFVLAVLFL